MGIWRVDNPSGLAYLCAKFASHASELQITNKGCLISAQTTRLIHQNTSASGSSCREHHAGHASCISKSVRSVWAHDGFATYSGSSERVCVLLQWRGACTPCRRARRWPNWKERKTASSGSSTWTSTSPASGGGPRRNRTRPRVSYQHSGGVSTLLQFSYNNLSLTTNTVVI